jgi:glyoxylase-like metal-dependent hydrolase (beta-lactamase superfamily II)
MPEIKTIMLSLPLKMGTVNCYLIKTDAGYVLIDTGSSNQRDALESELESAGCRPGTLDLIVLTHGDFDHAGNAAYLGKTFGAKIAMHEDDAGMVERGDMFWNRQAGNVLLRWLSPILFGFGKQKRFNPDLFVEDGSDLCAHGLDARIVDLPGHSKGSIGILAAAGDLFCGDLFENVEKPGLNSIMDDLAMAHASVERLAEMGVKTVYPGHGNPFSMDVLRQL